MLQNMICSTIKIRPAYKISAMYLLWCCLHFWGLLQRHLLTVSVKAALPALKSVYFLRLVQAFKLVPSLKLVPAWKIVPALKLGPALKSVHTTRLEVATSFKVSMHFDFGTNFMLGTSFEVSKHFEVSTSFKLCMHWFVPALTFIASQEGNSVLVIMVAD